MQRKTNLSNLWAKGVFSLVIFLIPGLAMFLGLIILFFLLVAWGRGMLRQMRLDTAASAAALSTARAQAALLNKFASHNILANCFINARFSSVRIVALCE